MDRSALPVLEVNYPWRANPHLRGSFQAEGWKFVTLSGEGGRLLSYLSPWVLFFLHQVWRVLRFRRKCGRVWMIMLYIGLHPAGACFFSNLFLMMLMILVWKAVCFRSQGRHSR